MSRVDGGGSSNRWSYLWVAEQLRQEILSGTYRPGKRLPGEPALARRFGVGRATVAKALEVLQQSNLVFRLRSSGTYVPREAARGTVTLTIGYLVPNISLLRSTPAGIALEAAQQYLEERGHAVRLLTRSEVLGSSGPAGNIRRMVRAGAINGLIVTDPLNPNLLHEVGEVLPVVCGGNDWVSDNVAAVGIDFTLGFFLATTHLLQLGHRRIGLLGGSVTSSIGYRSQQAFRLALQLAGVDPQSCPVALHGYDPEYRRREIDQMLQTYADLTGMVCGDDMIAMVAIEVARARGRSVPEQLSVVGCNDILPDALMHPQLTTLRIDFVTLGRRLAEVLLARIYGRDCPASQYLKPELLVRGSTAPAPRQ